MCDSRLQWKFHPLGGCNGSAGGRAKRGSSVLRSHDDNCLACQKAIFFTLLNNSTTDDAANLATTLYAIPDATRAVLECERQGRRRKRGEFPTPSHCGPVPFEVRLTAADPCTLCINLQIFAGSYATIQNLENTAQGK